MSLPKKALFNPQSKTAKLHQSGNHPAAGSAAAALQKVSEVRVGPGQSWVNLMRRDVEEYARLHAGGAAGANPGPGLLHKVSDGIKGLLKKLAKTP